MEGGKETGRHIDGVREGRKEGRMEGGNDTERYRDGVREGRKNGGREGELNENIVQVSCITH